MTKRHTVSIDDNAYKRLRKHGAFGESFNDLINRLMDMAERKK